MINYEKASKKMNKTSEIVLQVLEKHPKARDDDFVLYGFVIYYMGYNIDQSMRHFLGTAEQTGAPAFATITKCRRTLQGIYPQLKGKKAEARNEMQMVYRTYNWENE